MAASNVGRILLITGEYGKATEMFKIALGNARGVGDKEAEADALANLGLCFKASDRLTEALDWHTVCASSPSGNSCMRLADKFLGSTRRCALTGALIIVGRC